MMIKIDSSYIHDVTSATSAAELEALINAAVRLEFSIIPPYLTAMLSLIPGQNREIWNPLHSVVVDEMLHMTIACNVLNAIGGKPEIDSPGFVLQYPSLLPLSIADGLVVSLKPFSTDLVRQTFMEIEQPETPIDIRRALVETVETFATIGEFYQAMIDKIIELGNAIFIGDPTRQVASTRWFPNSRLQAIIDVDSAVESLRLIMEEGEGTPESPLDPDGDFAHYYRFYELAKLKRIAADPDAPEGYSFSGADISFDADQVYPITIDQRLADLDVESAAGRRAQQFAFTFTKLLSALQQTFDGSPHHLDAAMGLMFELKLAGQILVSLPAITNGSPTGSNAGPTFEYVSVNR
jgi:Ferritin-like